MTASATTTRTVASIMTSDPICVDRSDHLREVARIFDDNEISGAPVVDALNRVVGVISKTDILHRALVGPETGGPGSIFERIDEGADMAFDPTTLGVVEDVYTGDPVTVGPNETVAAVARAMAKERVHRLIVIDQARQPIGIVTTLDLLRYFPT